MLLLQVLLVTSIWSYGSIGLILTQSPLSTTKSEGSTARIKCVFTDFTGAFDSAAIHWYQQSPGEAPKRVLYFISAEAAVDDQSQKSRFTVVKDSLKLSCTFQINRAKKTDTGVYYCAYWDTASTGYSFKVFGSGTRLVVSDKQATPTAQGEMLHYMENSKETYVCLVHNFFPNVIQMYWKDKEGKKISDNVVQGEVWPAREDADSYSVSSWLTVNKEINKEYICFYEREGSGTQKVQAERPPATVTQTDNCIAGQANGTVFFKENFTHRTASLIYIVLLLKSSMYYVIVLFFIYRMKSPTKGPPRKKH